MIRKTLLLPVIFIFLTVAIACSEQVEHTAPAVNDSDSAAMMTTYGINMLISDSGVIKYRIVTERSVTNIVVNPKRTTFDKGVFLTQFDEKFHVQSYIQCDTAYKYDEQKIFELRGRVRILTKDGLKFQGEELFWDQVKHEYYSNMYSILETPERTIEGHYFRSDENMTKYYVSNSKGSFEKSDMIGEDAEEEKNDSIPQYKRPSETPRAKR